MTIETAAARTVDVVLVRHGESIWNTERRYQGHAGPGLSPAGFEQARAAAQVLVERFPQPAFVISSDLPRAKETAAEWVKLSGGELTYDPRWREIDVREWAGLLPGDVAHLYPEQLAAVERGEDIPRGNGETFAQLRERFWGVLNETAERLSRDDHDQPALIFTHGAGIRTAATLPLGIQPVQHGWLHHPANCSLTVFRMWMSEDHRVLDQRLVEYNTSTTAAAARALALEVQP